MYDDRVDRWAHYMHLQVCNLRNKDDAQRNKRGNKNIAHHMKGGTMSSKYLLIRMKKYFVYNEREKKVDQLQKTT